MRLQSGRGLENRLMWRAMKGGVLRVLLIKKLVEVGWHHNWATETSAAGQSRSYNDAERRELEMTEMSPTRHSGTSASAESLLTAAIDSPHFQQVLVRKWLKSKHSTDQHSAVWVETWLINHQLEHEWQVIIAACCHLFIDELVPHWLELRRGVTDRSTYLVHLWVVYS